VTEPVGSWVSVAPLPGQGWYPDPEGMAQRRWWDGTAWTWYVESNGAVQWDPLEIERAPEPAGVPGLGIATVGYLVANALAIAALVVLWALDHPGGKATALAVSEVGLWSGLLGACLIASKKRGTGSFTSDFGLRIRPIDVAFGLGGSLAARLMSGSAVLPLQYFFRNTSQPTRDVFNREATSPAAWTVLIIVTCVGAPIVEELFFRGLVQTRLIGRWGPVKGIAVTSLLFGAAHLTGWQGPITFANAWAIAAAGVALGTARYLTGRLGTSMMVHFFFNAQVILLLAIWG
jgi:membrane protease YdiL (CAAX protease family)